VVANVLSFVDYGNANAQANDMVLLRAGNLYLQYDRAKGYNSDALNAYRDRVVIAESPGDLEISNFVAALAKGQSVTYPNFNGVDSLIIEVCDQLTGSYDYAVVSLHMDDGTQKSQCRSGANVTIPAQPDIHPMNTTVLLDNSTAIGILVSENSSTSEKTKVKVVVGVVWGAVAVLVLVALYVTYRLRLRKRAQGCAQSATKPSTPRHLWMKHATPTVSTSATTAAAEDVEMNCSSDDSTTAPTTISPASSDQGSPPRGSRASSL
jgi:hypothetical protein